MNSSIPTNSLSTLFPVHWADREAFKLIKQLGDKQDYVLASGITPSGVVHFGNFREVMTVDLVARALRSKGKNVRFIFSWDDFDTFRKVPKNMPNQELLEKYLFYPIVETPDPYGKEESYAAFHMKNFEEELKKMGISLLPLRQSQKYKKGEYKDQIKLALKSSQKIKNILNKFRTQDLEDSWLPVSLYCEHCHRDKMEQIYYHLEKESLSYSCGLCFQKGELFLEKDFDKIKLPWRIDWPMRWAYEKVDFEPGGKDHSSQGGSYTTAKEIVQEVYQHNPPQYLQYDFVSIKGGSGKMSSSSGELFTVSDVLKVYTPEMIRWIFASYRPNVDFSFGFDLDVIKNYEDFDRLEKYCEEGLKDLSMAQNQKYQLALRTYQLAQLQENIPNDYTPPFRAPFRHLCNVLQIVNGDQQKALSYFPSLTTPEDFKAFEERAVRAWYWITHYAPEDFRFCLLKTEDRLDVLASLEGTERSFLKCLSSTLRESWEELETDKEVHEKVYAVIHEQKWAPEEAFALLYSVFLGKKQGPKLASLMRILGKEKTLEILQA